MELNNQLEIILNEVQTFEKFIEDDYFLGAGKISIAFFLLTFGEYKKNESIIDLAIDNFEVAYNSIEKNNVRENPSLLSGYAGVAWFYQHLIEKGYLNNDDSFFEYFDTILLEQCKIDALSSKYDLFYGIVGYGIYFLKRHKNNPENYQNILKIIEFLKSCSLEDDHGIYWKCDIFTDAKDKVNLGMAHGIPSIICFLTKAYQIKEDENIKEIIIKSINWLLAQKNSDPNTITSFPYLCDDSNTINNEVKETKTTRLAWCYGDLMIGYSIFLFGYQTKIDYYIDEGLTILKKCAARKIEDKDTSIMDRAFCHGTSGVFYIFNKIAKEYNQLDFIEISDYWANQTFNNPKNDKDFYNSFFVNGEKSKYVKDIGIINGISGIGLTLLSQLDKKNTDWEAFFGL